MDDPNITMEEYIRLEEEKARRHVFDDAFTSEVTLSCEPTVSPLNDNKINFRISFDESYDEDYTVIYDKNSFSYKIIYVNDLKTDLKNDNDKIDIEQPSGDMSVKPLPDLINIDDGAYAQESNKLLETIIMEYLTTKETRPIQHIGGSQYAVPKKSNTPYRRSSIRHTQEVQYTIPEELNMPYPGSQIRRSITTWEDLTTRFLAQFFPLRRTAKLRNDILMFQQHHRESLSEALTRFKDLLQKVPHHGTDLWLQVQIYYDPVTPDLVLYDNENWNNPRDFAKPFKAISLPHDVPSTSDCHLIELKNHVQLLMEAHLALMQPTQVNKITTSYARLSKFETNFKQQQSEMTNKIDTVLKAITDQIAGALPSDRVKNPKLRTYLVLSARSYPIVDLRCSSHPSTSINAIKTCYKEANISQTSQLQPEMRSGTQQPEEPEPTLEDEFQDLHLNKS
ncbi:MAK10-like protein [Tanacetum coccineum]